MHTAYSVRNVLLFHCLFNQPGCVCCRLVGDRSVGDFLFRSWLLALFCVRCDGMYVTIRCDDMDGRASLGWLVRGCTECGPFGVFSCSRAGNTRHAVRLRVICSSALSRLCRVRGGLFVLRGR